MFEVFLRADKLTHSITPVIHCSVDNVLIKTTLLRNQSFFFRMIDVADLTTVDLLLQNLLNLILQQIQIRVVR